MSGSSPPFGERVRVEQGPTMPHPDFRWTTHSTPWGTERWLHVGRVPVAHVDELQGTCYISYRSNRDADAWISLRTDSVAGGVATVERWASAHVRELRLLGKTADAQDRTRVA